MPDIHPTADDVVANLQKVKDTIAAESRLAGRPPSDVSLIAVTKTHSPHVIRPCLETHHRHFGENRVQEAEEKWPALKEAFPKTVLHLIGPLQRNKVRRAVRLFDVLQTVDRIELARAIAVAVEQEGRKPDILIQVNTGSEVQKHGILPDAADDLIAHCVDDLALPVRGLMCIPPVGEDPVGHFMTLADISARNGLSALSMGMSGDYATAIRNGATFVRVGTAIFGARPTPAG